MPAKKSAIKMVGGKPTVIDPDKEEISDEQAAAMKARQDFESQQRKQEADDDEAREAYNVRGYKKGGAVRGVGCAVKGHGKGTVY